MTDFRRWAAITGSDHSLGLGVGTWNPPGPMVTEERDMGQDRTAWIRSEQLRRANQSPPPETEREKELRQEVARLHEENEWLRGHLRKTLGDTPLSTLLGFDGTAQLPESMSDPEVQDDCIHLTRTHYSGNSTICVRCNKVLP